MANKYLLIHFLMRQPTREPIRICIKQQSMKRKPFVSVAVVLCTVLSSYLYSCSKGDSVADMGTTPPATGTCSGTAGPLFTAVRTLVTSRCVSCHNATSMNGGMNFATECNIVTAKTRIKVRAVDEGTMPPTGSLSATDKATITNWINAGGRYTD